MGLISNIFGFGSMARDIGTAVRENTEVFHINETEEMHANAQKFQSSISQFENEFSHAPDGVFGRFVDGLNRLPRPFMALGTICLFVFALYDPVRFSLRMQGLQEVPDPLWWLMGAIVSFYFGARELHYFRAHKKVDVTPKTPKLRQAKIQPQPKAVQSQMNKIQTKKSSSPSQTISNASTTHFPKSSDNPAIQDFLKSL